MKYKKKAAIPITISIDGLLISGYLVSAVEYFEGLADQMSNPSMSKLFRNKSKEAAKVADTLAKKYDKAEESAKTDKREADESDESEKSAEMADILAKRYDKSEESAETDKREADESDESEKSAETANRKENDPLDLAKEPILRFLHLRDAYILPSTLGTFMPGSGEGFWWRCRLDAVTGFTWNAFAAPETSESECLPKS